MNVNVVCVMKSGGDYDDKYVSKLYEGVRKHASLWMNNFVCISDVPLKIREEKLINVVSPDLLPTWWSKLSAFALRGPTLYLDLDTIIAEPLDRFMRQLSYAHDVGIEELWMMESFRWKRGATLDPQERWASGIMAWTGDWSWLHENVSLEMMKAYAWDQRYISMRLEKKKITPKDIHAVLNVVSYKRHVLAENKVPDGTDVVCFHGHPRPHQIGWKLP